MKRAMVLALCLAMLAGHVDGLGTLRMKGYFVSFMSGNSTQLAVGLAVPGSASWLIAGTLIVLFVTGVIAGTLVGREAFRRQPTLLGLVTGLLALGAGFATVGQDHAALGLAAVAMGAVNAVVQRAGTISLSLTYMTGTLVKMGQQIALALTGGERLGWVPYLALWASLVGGALVGGAVYPLVGLRGLWGAALWCGILVLVTRSDPDRTGDDPAAAS